MRLHSLIEPGKLSFSSCVTDMAYKYWNQLLYNLLQDMVCVGYEKN